MDAVKFLEERQRMCDMERKKGCISCGLASGNSHTDMQCDFYPQKYPQQAVAVIEKWSAEHPVKSYLDVFKEAMKSVGVEYTNDDFIPDVMCVKSHFYPELPRQCNLRCKEHWNKECKLPIKGE